ncbi:MAG: hypothetical protein P8181_08195 [bacterium]
MRPDISLDTLTGLGLEPAAARALVSAMDAIPRETPPVGVWLEVSRTMLSPDTPFDVHLHLYKAIFEDWDPGSGPPPAWVPSIVDITASNIASLCKRAGVPEVRSLHQWSAGNREVFWETIIDTLGIKFKSPPQAIVNIDAGVDRGQLF